MNLKSTLLKILDVVGLVGGPIARSVVELARWAVNRFVPDSVEVASPLVGDAPDAVKNYVSELFDTALGYVSNYFLRKALEAVKYMVVTYALDRVWDAIHDRVTVAEAGAVVIDDDAVASAINGS